MAIDLYKPFTNPITRETFRCLSFTEEAFTMEWTVQPGGYVPFEHIHLSQDEIFHVQQGEIRARINGQEQIGKVGQTLLVPRGTRHIAFNDKSDALICTVEYKPGLDQFKVMQFFAGFTLDQDVDRRGLVNIPKFMYCLKKAKAKALVRPYLVPEPFFRLGMNIFFMLGTVAGWETLYRKYAD
jgi:quercetin dioxygenase-like cupin family protein